MNHIYLTGMMGSGKSTVGSIIADTLNLPFIDLDNVIEKSAGKTIAAIFVEDGESQFRYLESQTLKLYANGGRAIISCGGGIILSAENRGLMKLTGKVVLLSAKIDTLLSRIKAPASRPLLNQVHTESSLIDILNEREIHYKSTADLEIDTNNYTPEEIAKKIIDTSKS